MPQIRAADTALAALQRAADALDAAGDDGYVVYAPVPVADALRDLTRHAPGLVKALRAVLELHQPDRGSCRTCNNWDASSVTGWHPVPWPCPTVQAIHAALTPAPEVAETSQEADRG